MKFDIFQKHPLTYHQITKPSSMIRMLIYVAVILLFIMCTMGCKNSSQTEEWSLTFGMTGGVAGFMDRVEIKSDGKAEYFKFNNRLAGFELLDEIRDKVAWMVSRDDLLQSVGEYKGGMDVMDDIRYSLTILIKEKTYKIEWDSRSNHPAVLDEIRPTLDDIISDARKLVAN
ncbi:MAG: hypothetical protein ABIG42_01465 [bacterium]